MIIINQYIGGKLWSENGITQMSRDLKGNTARWLFLSHPEIKESLWGGHLWNPSYFVATVSERSFDQVKAYIESQKNK